MLTDLDDDFFFEEDKISNVTTNNVETSLLLQIEGETSMSTAQQLIDTESQPQHQHQQQQKQQQQLHCQEQEQPQENDKQQQELSEDVTAVVCTLQNAAINEQLRFNDFTRQAIELERLGMTVTTNSVVVKKDDSNLIGISIGGGAPLCPCLYIVQVFDGTPAAREGSLQSGDELLAVNSLSVKGKTKVEVAKMIQTAPTDVTIHYNKLHADPEQGKSLDIILKKLKHRIVDNMSSNTADTLGLSRAILCNDSLVRRLEELEGTELMYKGLVDHARRMLKAYYDLLQTYKSFGDCFTQISAREPQQRASEAFRTFGEFHRHLEKDGLKIIKQIKPVLADLGTYLNKAIPDTKLTVRKYADAKFTYLSYCLKVKEMDDEEHGFVALQEPLYRVETGNYEYRLILRCRQEARSKFAKLRTDVLEKMELLECKHATDLNKQLRSLLDSLAELNTSLVERIDALPPLFPIEVDFKDTAFQYKSSTLKPQELDDDEEANNKSNSVTSTEIVCGLEAVEEPAPVLNVQQRQLLTGFENGAAEEAPTSTTTNEIESNEMLLKELGLFGVNLQSNSASVHAQQLLPKQNLPTGNGNGNGNGAYDFDLFLNQAAAAAASTTSSLERDLMSANALETDLLLQ